MAITPEAIRQGTHLVDVIAVGSLLSKEEKEIRDRVRSFVDQEVIPTAAEYWDKAEFPFDLLLGLGELGLAGGSFSEEYGCAGWKRGVRSGDSRAGPGFGEPGDVPARPERTGDGGHLHARERGTPSSLARP
jgi:hypothetical protein